MLIDDLLTYVGYIASINDVEEKDLIVTIKASIDKENTCALSRLVRLSPKMRNLALQYSIKNSTMITYMIDDLNSDVSDSSELISIAIDNDDLDMLKYLESYGCNITMGHINRASDAGKTDILNYMYENIDNVSPECDDVYDKKLLYPDDEQTIMASLLSIAEKTKCVSKNMMTFTEPIIHYAVDNDNLTIIQNTVSLGKDQRLSCFKYAVNKQKLYILDIILNHHNEDEIDKFYSTSLKNEKVFTYLFNRGLPISYIIINRICCYEFIDLIKYIENNKYVDAVVFSKDYTKTVKNVRLHRNKPENDAFPVREYISSIRTNELKGLIKYISDKEKLTLLKEILNNLE